MVTRAREIRETKRERKEKEAEGGVEGMLLSGLMEKGCGGEIRGEGLRWRGEGRD